MFVFCKQKKPMSFFFLFASSPLFLLNPTPTAVRIKGDGSGQSNGMMGKRAIENRF